jgi:hypothetical protein
VRLFIIVASVAVAVGRFTVPSHGFSWPGTYEAIAHIWVGVLIGFGCKARDGDTRHLSWWALAAITAVEVGAAVLLK